VTRPTEPILSPTYSPTCAALSGFALLTGEREAFIRQIIADGLAGEDSSCTVDLGDSSAWDTGVIALNIEDPLSGRTFKVQVHGWRPTAKIPAIDLALQLESILDGDSTSDNLRTDIVRPNFLRRLAGCAEERKELSDRLQDERNLRARICRRTIELMEGLENYVGSVPSSALIYAKNFPKGVIECE
jgi:hypothetical protein